MRARARIMWYPTRLGESQMQNYSYVIENAPHTWAQFNLVCVAHGRCTRSSWPALWRARPAKLRCKSLPLGINFFVWW